ncbi:MAG: flagellar hook capping FlgD N-terminal domain-containing protein [Vampirovibrionales bacterium]|nr:flagellar hook capping FlgD N-terminal domain-containing protein [Vampirovibrionales bacterium]
MSSVQSILTNLQNNTAAVQFQQGQKNVAAGNTELDSNAFLNLMLIQLRNQDPTNPMDSSAFLQQQAAFTQIQKLDTLTTAVQQGNQLANASSLVGKNVLITDGQGNNSTIRVDSVVLDDRNQLALRSGGSIYTTNQILEIYGGTPSTP